MDPQLRARPRTDPANLYRLRDGVYAVELFIAALTELDLFTELAREPLDLEGICRRLSLAPRPAEVMLTLFRAMGLLSTGGGKLAPTPVAAEHLVRGSPWHLGPYYSSLRDRPLVKSMLEVLRSGKPARFAQEEGPWEKSMEEEGFAERFTAEMDCRGRYLGPLLAERLDLGGRGRLLDVGGGSGVYSAALAARNPALRAVVLEKPPVDAVARRHIAERGLADRVEALAGDMFSGPLPRGHDLHLYSNVLHDWDRPEVRRLLQSSFEALEPGGMVIVHDAHLDRDKAGPIEVAEYSVLLMLFTEGRCYSVGEIEEMLGAAGFREPRRLETAVGRSAITAVRGP